MKTTKKWNGALIIAAMVLLFGFVLAGCDDGKEEGNGTITISGTPKVGETLTATCTEAAESSVNSIYWYRNDSNSTTGGISVVKYQGFPEVHLEGEDASKYIYASRTLSNGTGVTVYSNVLGPVTAAE